MAIQILKVVSVTSEPNLLLPNWKSNSAELWKSPKKASFLWFSFRNKSKTKFVPSKENKMLDSVILVDKTIKRTVFATNCLNALEKGHMSEPMSSIAKVRMLLFYFFHSLLFWPTLNINNEEVRAAYGIKHIKRNTFPLAVTKSWSSEDCERYSRERSSSIIHPNERFTLIPRN